eukprot:comp18372_c0_seq1/m.19530 comp18372_c0_seq1/g.19530  ORF comp18372_c0_seq1/g.19530 comp18372_c0_seq1/m.19530 type:complete len:392 (-) comp18372_c0_seq1:15-1190(-)
MAPNSEKRALMAEPIPADPIPPKHAPVQHASWQIQLARVIGLRYVEDLRTLLWIALYFVEFWFMWNFGEFLSWPVWLAAMVIISTFSFSGATITHNTMHCHMFDPHEHHLRNRFVHYALTLTYGHPVTAFIPGHNLSHHKHTQLRKDHMRTSKLRYRWHLLNLILYQPSVAMSVLKGDLEYALLQRDLGRQFFSNLMSEFGFLFGVTAALLILSVKKFTLYFQIPHLFAQWAIVSINLLQHDGCDIHEDCNQHGNITRNFVGGFINYMFFNNGYHGIHHIHPIMHWSKLAEAHEREVKPTLHPALDQENMGTYLFKTFIYPGKRVTYEGKPLVFTIPEEEDKDAVWIVYPKHLKREDLTLEAQVQKALAVISLLAAKMISPMYSPIVSIDD